MYAIDLDTGFVLSKAREAWEPLAPPETMFAAVYAFNANSEGGSRITEEAARRIAQGWGADLPHPPAS